MPLIQITDSMTEPEARIAQNNNNAKIPAVNPVTFTAYNSGTTLIAHNCVAIDYGSYGIVTGTLIVKTANNSGNPAVVIGSPYLPMNIPNASFVPYSAVKAYATTGGTSIVQCEINNPHITVKGSFTSSDQVWINVNYRYK